MTKKLMFLVTFIPYVLITKFFSWSADLLTELEELCFKLELFTPAQLDIDEHPFYELTGSFYFFLRKLEHTFGLWFEDAYFPGQVTLTDKQLENYIGYEDNFLDNLDEQINLS